MTGSVTGIYYNGGDNREKIKWEVRNLQENFLQLRQEPRLVQKLIMTPALLQSIKLLNLSQPELADKIQQELTENPALEEVDESANEENNRNLVEWQNYLEPYNSERNYQQDKEPRKPSNFEAYSPNRESLSEYLVWQLLMTGPTPKAEKIGNVIAGSLDRKGYLELSVEEISVMSNATLEEVEQVLSLMQSFDPPGVCARDLEECLLIQALQAGFGNSMGTDIIVNHLKDLEKKDYKAVCRALGTTVEEVIKAVNVIKGLEPKPGRQFSGDRPQYIEPDIFVQKVGGDFEITLSNGGMPRLRINSVYRDLLENMQETPGEARDFLCERIHAARWLMKSICQRQRTIHKVMESILRLQRDFFRKGISHLKPMVLRDVAEDINMAEATVSRVTTNKYVQTPMGVFSLKYFFNSSINRIHGEPVASETVRQKMKGIILAEDSKEPYTDDKISEILKAVNINIARRTVAKYREKLGIPASSKRRQF